MGEREKPNFFERRSAFLYILLLPSLGYPHKTQKLRLFQVERTMFTPLRLFLLYKASHFPFSSSFLPLFAREKKKRINSSLNFSFSLEPFPRSLVQISMYSNTEETKSVLLVIPFLSLILQKNPFQSFFFLVGSQYHTTAFSWTP